MPQFQFRLATLLRLREATRDERRTELADVQRADAELENRLTQVAVEQEQLRTEYRTIAAPGPVELPPLVRWQQYGAALRRQESSLNEQRRTLAVEIDRRRQAVIEADREVRTLEKLRQGQADAYRQDAERLENKRLDESAARMKHGESDCQCRV
jgi:flagellar protein FliJ